MICNLFFSGKLKEGDMLFYEEDFVLFCVIIQLIETNKFSKNMVENILENLYGKENIKNNKVLDFCENHFITVEKEFKLNINNEEIVFYNKTREFKKNITNYIKIDKKVLYNVLKKEVMNNKIPFFEKLKRFIIFNCYNETSSRLKEYVLLYKYFYIIKNYYKIFRIIDYKLKKIPSLFNNVEILELNLNEQQSSLLIFNNIFILKNLKNVSVEILMCIFCDSIKGFIKILDKYSISKKEIIVELEKDFNKIVKKEWNEILEKRIGIFSKKSTLKEIGRSLNLTRERIRQIEENATDKICNYMNDKQIVIYYFYKEINVEQASFITTEDFIKYIDNSIVATDLLVAINSVSSRIKYDDKYGIIYDSKETDISNIIKDAEESLKEIIPIKEKNSFNKVQNYIIEKKYRIYQEKVLVKRKINISAVYINEIEENFMNGYGIGNDDDYNKLLKIIKDKYGNIKLPSKHSIQAMIDRDEFVQIDRGIYKARKYCAALPEKLFEKIIGFIIKSTPIILYSSIFEEFKNDLKKFDINNRFYLKGLIDKKLPEQFNTARDCITINSIDNITTYDIMKKIFKSFEGEFTIDDVRKKMIGLNTYICENYAKREEDNGLIKVSAKTYVYIDKLKITEEIKIELKQFINNLFKKMDSKILTSKKIYANLNILNKELFNKLHITAKFGDFELFSIIQYLFKDEYFFSRPIISLQEDFTTSSYLLIKEYVSRFEKFNYTDIKNYVCKMNIGGLYSYMSFMEDLSDEYVQISKDEMIRKDKLAISEANLLKIKELLDLILKNNDLKMEEFNGYFMLPKIDRGWNKYLLVGIIRSYFKDEYQIENTGRFYDTTDFIIRRIS